jgi:hypothetical protein
MVSRWEFIFTRNKSIEVEVEKQENFVESLSEDGSLKQLNISGQLSTKIYDKRDANLP